MPVYPPILPPVRITYTLLNAMVPDVTVKPTTTPRASTVAVADDPDLVLSGEPGTWQLSFDVCYIGPTAADIRTAWGVTGTAASGYRCTDGAADTADAGGPTNASKVRFRAIPIGNAGTVELGYPTDGALQSWLREFSPAVVFTTNWTVAFRWSQITSNASPTQVLATSTASKKRIA